MRRLVSLAIAAAAIGASLAACTEDGGSAGEAKATSSTTATVAGTSIVEAEGWAPPGDEWVALPPPPIEPSSTQVTSIPAGFLVMGWLDEGGDEIDPLLFDAATGTWTVLPSPPVDDPILNSTILPTTSGFAVIGVRCGEMSEVTRTSDVLSCDPAEPVGLRYDLDAGWSPIELPTGSPEVVEVSPGDRGTAVARLDGSLALVPIGDEWFTWAPDDDTWTAIDAPPPATFGSTRCATDEGMVQLGPEGVASAAVLGDDGAWAAVPPPVEDATMGFALCTDSSAVASFKAAGPTVVEYELDPVERRWREVAARPVDWCQSGWPIDEGAVGRCEVGRLLAFDRTAGTWTELPVLPEPSPSAVAADGVAVAVVSDGDWHFEARDLTP